MRSGSATSFIKVSRYIFILFIITIAAETISNNVDDVQCAAEYNLNETDMIFEGVVKTLLLKYSKKPDCLSYKQDKFWSYDWCFNGSIHQNGSKHVSFEKYLIGTEENFEIKLGKETSVSLHYSSGDICKKPSIRREAQVNLMCCSMSKFNAFIDLIKETSLCKYSFNICVPEVCHLSKVHSLIKDKQLNLTSSYNDILIAIEENNLEHDSSKLFSSEHLATLQEEVKTMFYKAYNAYLTNAFPKDELLPLSCDGTNFELTAGDMLTLIDSLDTLIVFGNYSEFRRAVKIVADNLDFNVDDTVSVFETNIRVLGGLLSAHIFAEDTNIMPSYNGELLELAIDLGDRLLPSFETRTGIPYGTVHLQTGVPKDETTHACTSAAGSLSLEFGMLSVLSGDNRYGLAARRALANLFERRSDLDLVGRHIDIESGTWVEAIAGIGPNVDSFYEYALKHYILFGDEESFEMYQILYEGAIKHLKKGSRWYKEVNMNQGKTIRKVFNNLMSFWPGLQTLSGDIIAASRTTNAFLSVWNDFGFTPEDFNYEAWQPVNTRNSKAYPLRPELIESVLYLHEATNDTSWLRAGMHVLASLKRTEVNPNICKGAHATVLSVKPSPTQTFADVPGINVSEIIALLSSSEEVDDKQMKRSVDIIDYIFQKPINSDIQLLEREVQFVFPQIDASLTDSLSEVLQLLQNLSPTNTQVYLKDYMPSFFLSEVCKYLYLLFAPEHEFRGKSGEKYLFTTEAHIFPINLTYQELAADMGFAFPYAPTNARSLHNTWKKFKSESSISDEFYFERECPAEMLNMPGKAESYYMYDDILSVPASQLFSSGEPEEDNFLEEKKSKGYFQSIFDVATKMFTTTTAKEKQDAKSTDSPVKVESKTPSGLVTTFLIYPYDEGGFGIIEESGMNYLDVRRLGTRQTKFFFGYSGEMIASTKDTNCQSCEHDSHRWNYKKVLCPLVNTASFLEESLKMIKTKQDIAYRSFQQHYVDYAFADTTLKSANPIKGHTPFLLLHIDDTQNKVCQYMLPVNLVVELSALIIVDYSTFFLPIALTLHESLFTAPLNKSTSSSLITLFEPYPFLACTYRDQKQIEAILEESSEEEVIPLVQRGGCMFEDKADMFSNTNSQAVLISQHTDWPLFAMSGKAPDVSFPENVGSLKKLKNMNKVSKPPVFMISYYDDMIIHELKNKLTKLPSLQLRGSIERREIQNNYFDVDISDGAITMNHPAGWIASISVQDSRWTLSIIDNRE